PSPWNGQALSEKAGAGRRWRSRSRPGGSGRAEVRHVSSVPPPGRSSRRARKGRRGNLYRRRRSRSATLAGDQLSSRNLEGRIPIYRLQAIEKIRPPRRRCRRAGHELRNHPPPFGNLNLLTLPKQVLDLPKTIAQIAHGGFFHVMHYSITTGHRLVSFCKNTCGTEQVAPSWAYLALLRRTQLGNDRWGTRVQGRSFGVRRLDAAFARRDSSRRTSAPVTSHRGQKAG